MASKAGSVRAVVLAVASAAIAAGAAAASPAAIGTWSPGGDGPSAIVEVGGGYGYGGYRHGSPGFHRDYWRGGKRYRPPHAYPGRGYGPPARVVRPHPCVVRIVTPTPNGRIVRVVNVCR